MKCRFIPCVISFPLELLGLQHQGSALGCSHQSQGSAAPPAGTSLTLPRLLSVTPVMRALPEATGPGWSGSSWGGRGPSGASGATLAQPARVQPVPPA